MASRLLKHIHSFCAIDTYVVEPPTRHLFPGVLLHIEKKMRHIRMVLKTMLVVALFYLPTLGSILCAQFIQQFFRGDSTLWTVFSSSETLAYRMQSPSLMSDSYFLFQLVHRVPWWNVEDTIVKEPLNIWNWYLVYVILIICKNTDEILGWQL